MKKLIILLTGVILVACNSKKEVSVAYYRAHIEEARQEYDRCDIDNKGENPNSCANAEIALRQVLEAREKKESEAFDKETQNINDAYHPQKTNKQKANN